MRRSVDSLRQIASLAKEYNQAPSQAQRYVELTRSCNDDLQQLIKLRNDHADVLGRDSAALNGIDATIAEAQAGLDRLTSLIESGLPEALRGRTAFRNKLKWALVHSPELADQQPALSRIHTDVINEMESVRQMIIMASFGGTKEREQEQPQQTSQRRSEDAKVTTMFENITLLNDLFGDASATTIPATNSKDSPPVIEIDLTTSAITLADIEVPQKKSYVLGPRLSVDLHDVSLAANGAVRYEAIPPSHRRTVGAPPSYNYYDEKEVVPVSSRHHHNATKCEPAFRPAATTPDNIGLSVLFGDDTSLTPSPPPLRPHTSFISTVSHASFLSTKPSTDSISLLSSTPSSSVPISGSDMTS